MLTRRLIACHFLGAVACAASVTAGGLIVTAIDIDRAMMIGGIVAVGAMVLVHAIIEIAGAEAVDHYERLLNSDHLETPIWGYGAATTTDYRP